MSLSHSPKIVTDGLVLYLDAANPKSYPGSGTTWYDLSRNENNDAGVSSSAVYTNNNQGELSYSTTVATVYPANYGLTLNNETISFFAKCNFIRVNSLGGSFDNRIAQWGRYYVNNSGGFGLQSGGFYAYLKGSTKSGWSASSSSSVGATIYDTYDWIYYVIKFTGNNNISIYMNNQQAFNVNISDGYTGYTSNSLAFGTNMNMILSNVSLYNRILSDNEIKQNFNALRGRFGI